MEKLLMALDAGTTSNRCILFNKKGTIVKMQQRELRFLVYSRDFRNCASRGSSPGQGSGG